MQAPRAAAATDALTRRAVFNAVIITLSPLPDWPD